MNDEDMRIVETIEDAAWRLDDLAIAGTRPQLTRPASTFRMCVELTHMSKDTLDQCAGSERIFQGYVVCNCLKISDCRLSPDYFSHLPKRFPACAWVSVRFSATATSPRAMPSRIAIRFCWSW